MRTKGLKIFAGNSNRKLAESICSILEVPLGHARIEKFPDGESLGSNAKRQPCG